MSHFQYADVIGNLLEGDAEICESRVEEALEMLQHETLKFAHLYRVINCALLVVAVQQRYAHLQ